MSFKRSWPTLIFGAGCPDTQSLRTTALHEVLVTGVPKKTVTLPNEEEKSGKVATEAKRNRAGISRKSPEFCFDLLGHLTLTLSVRSVFL